MELHELVLKMKQLERHLTLYEEKYGLLSQDFHDPTVSESRIKRITRIARITPHIPTAALSFPLRCVFRIPHRPSVSESRIKRITRIARITPHIPTTALSFPLRYVLRMPRPIRRRDRPLCLSLSLSVPIPSSFFYLTKNAVVP